MSCSLEKRADFFMKKATRMKVDAELYYFNSDTSYIIKSNVKSFLNPITEDVEENELNIYID